MSVPDRPTLRESISTLWAEINRTSADSAIWDDLAGRGTTLLELLRENKAIFSSPRINKVPVAAIRGYARLLRVTDTALPADNELCWIPFGAIGPVLLIGHFAPMALQEIPFPSQLVQPVILPAAAYRELHKAFWGNVAFLTDLLRDTGLTRSASQHPWTVNGANSHPGAPLEKQALEWLLSLDLISDYDRGMATSIMEEAAFKAEKLSTDMQLALKHVCSGAPIARSDQLNFAYDAPALLTQSQSERMHFFPFWHDAKTVAILCSDLSERRIDDHIASHSTMHVLKVLVTKETITALYQNLAFKDFGKAHRRQQIGVAQGDKADFEIVQSEIERLDVFSTEDAKATVHWILFESVRRGAADIHIEEVGDFMRVRIAVDRSGQKLLELPRKRLPPITILLKDHSSIKMDGIRKGDGRFSFNIGARVVDVRVSLIVVRGEEPKWTLRIHDKTMGIKSVMQLGFSKEDLALFSKAYRSPHGMIVVSGPTGHGKSTTLYAAIADLNSPELFIYTLEDPVENVIPGVSQIKVSSDPEQIKAGATSFVDGLKDVLRAGPNVIMVAEIRDRETARAAVNAASTGHLVFTTIHANDCGTIIERLRGFDVDQFEFSNSVLCLMNQRLLRRLCSCHSYAVTSEEQRRVFECAKVEPIPKYYHTRVGCESCGGSGYRGVVAVLEILYIDAEIREAIKNGASARSITEIASKSGFRNLYEKALDMVAKGLTDFDEVSRVCIAG